jgi:hypothetical protein
MPVCTEHGCPVIVDRSGRCPAHARAKSRTRGSRQDRGYDREHDRQRARWAPVVARGTVTCAKCSRLIEAGQEWDLGHTDDRTTWTGPEHQRCNRQAAGRKAHT